MMISRRTALVAIISLVLVTLTSFSFGAWGAQNDPVIDTLAGGDVGDGRSATETPLNRPIDIVLDGEGNIYFVEESTDRVRRIDAVTGLISTVAGNGISGFSGDGGLATNANLNAPQAIALDAAGNLYIADGYNHRVRRVDARTGIITTVAGDGSVNDRPKNAPKGDGGPATKSSLNQPAGLAVDDKALYISDSDVTLTSNNRIRRIDLATGIITTYAGIGTTVTDVKKNGDGGPATKASLKPTGLALDANGNLYIADQSTHVVRKIDRSTGIISRIAGDGWVNYYRTDYPQTACRAGSGRFNGDSAQPGEALRPSLNYPNDLAVDAQGNVYIADRDNQRIRRLSADGQWLTTVAGSGTWDFVSGVLGGYEGDGGPANSDKAKLNTPRGVAVDGAGNIFIADSQNSRIRVVGSSGTINTAAGKAVAFGDRGPATQAGLFGLGALAADAQGNIFIGQFESSVVRRVDARTGIITTVAGNGIVGYGGDGGPATAASLGGVIGLAVDSSGNLYISELIGQRIRRVDLATGRITTAAGKGTAGFSGDGGPATDAEMKYPRGIAVGPGDDLYIADSCNNRIRKVEKRTGIITTVVGNGAATAADQLCDLSNNPCKGGFDGDGKSPLQASLYGPLDVAVAANGNIIIADTQNLRIRSVDVGKGIINTIAGDGKPAQSEADLGDGKPASKARFTTIRAVAVDGAGNIIIADAEPANRIRRIEAASGKIETIVGVGNGWPGFSGDGGPAVDAKLRLPVDIAVLPDGSFVFSDTYNSRVRHVK
jgi:trimeric autotransporter adhesin